ncbi:MAG: hypothetical protein V3U07_04845, partial [Nitrospirales bacterium]
SGLENRSLLISDLASHNFPVPSINSSALKYLSFSDTARLDEFFDHTGIEFHASPEGSLP